MAVTYTTIPELQLLDVFDQDLYLIVQAENEGTVRVLKDDLLADVELDVSNVQSRMDQVEAQVDALSNNNYIMDEVLHSISGRSSRVKDGYINYRKWSDGTLEYWGWGRQNNIKFNGGAYFGGYRGINDGVSGSGSTDFGELRFTVWGSYAVPFIEAPSVNVWLSSYDYSTSSAKELIIINTYREITSDASRNNLTLFPCIEVIGLTQGTTMGHPVFSFRAVGRWK